MTEGFSNPIVGGIDLVIPAIESPNFVAGTSGWIIRADGSAEFNNATFRGTVVITAGGQQLLVYDGAPAAGTLMMAISSVDGTDSFGNKYWAGQSFIHGTSAAGSRGRISFGINDLNVNDSGMILSYIDALLTPHLILEGPADSSFLDLVNGRAFLAGPNGNQIEVDDTNSGIFITSQNSMQLQALGVGGIMVGTNGTPFREIKVETQNTAFAAVNSVNTSHTFATAFPTGVVPTVQLTEIVGANNDILPNLQSAPTATGFSFRLFQKTGVAVTTTVTTEITAIG